MDTWNWFYSQIDQCTSLLIIPSNDRRLGYSCYAFGWHADADFVGFGAFMPLDGHPHKPCTRTRIDAVKHQSDADDAMDEMVSRRRRKGISIQHMITAPGCLFLIVMPRNEIDLVLKFIHSSHIMFPRKAEAPPLISMEHTPPYKIDPTLIVIQQKISDLVHNFVHRRHYSSPSNFKLDDSHATKDGQCMKLISFTNLCT